MKPWVWLKVILFNLIPLMSNFFLFKDITLPRNFISSKFTIGLESAHLHVSIMEVLSPKERAMPNPQLL